MTRHELKNEYFEWMCSLVCDNKYIGRQSYKRLLNSLHCTEFTYTIGMDGNRAEDGIDLRYRFGYEYRIDNSKIAAFLDDCPCSVLEMLIALSLRCEEHIMDNPESDSGIGQWFWEMIKNLGLYSMNDSHFDTEYVNEVTICFLDRKYKRNGEGGLFTVKKHRNDMRTTDIWYQMMWYLDEVLKI